MPFSVQEVADILKVSPDTVGKGRTNIRKKIGMTEVRGKIADFVLLKITERRNFRQGEAQVNLE